MIIMICNGGNDHYCYYHTPWRSESESLSDTARFNISVKRQWDQPPWPRGCESICQCLTAPVLLLFIPQGSKAGQPLKPPCRPGFSQNFYTVIVSRDVLHGQSILKGKAAACWISFIDWWYFLFSGPDVPPPSLLPPPSLTPHSVIEWVSVCVCVCLGSPSQQHCGRCGCAT